MDKNTQRGIKHQIQGTAKELAGKVTGDKSRELAGKAEKDLGKVERKVGEKTDELVDKIRKDS